MKRLALTERYEARDQLRALRATALGAASVLGGDKTGVLALMEQQLGELALPGTRVNGRRRRG